LRQLFFTIFYFIFNFLQLRKFHEHLFGEIGLVFSKINREELLKKSGGF